MRFGVLGPLEGWTEEGRPVRVPETKVRALLADLLVHRGHPVSPDRLADDLWGGRPPADPAAAVQTRVWQLRRALDLAEPGARDLVVRGPAGYLLRAGTDADRFTELGDRARAAGDPADRAALLTEALGLWRGTAYADFADEDFARPEIHRLEELRLAALEDLAEARLDLGDHLRVTADLADLVSAHPLRERLHALHILALYRAGRQHEALTAYHALRTRLADDLGLDPSPSLRSLHEAILRHDPSLVPPPRSAISVPPGDGAAAGPPGEVAASGTPAGPPREIGETGDGGPYGGPGSSLAGGEEAAPAAVPYPGVPVPVNALVGREDDLSGVREALGSARVVTLVGPGGVGKTRLALEVAAGLGGRVLVVELGGPGDPGEEVLAGLGVPDDGAMPVDDRVVAALRGVRGVLVLDNCEHVIERAAELVVRVAAACPRMSVLATSREPLGVPGEALWPVEPLDVPESAGVEAVRRAGAARLFLDRVAAAAPGFRLDEENAAAVAAVCARLDGIPLALELAATRVRGLGVHELARRLGDEGRFRVLDSGRRGVPARQRTLRAVIDWSWDLLSGAERVVLRRLSAHAEGWDLEAAESVCAGGEVAAEEVAGLLARLVDRSLVAVTPAGRYRLLESVGAYAAERLAESGEAAAVRLRHVRHYLELAELAAPGLRGPDQRRWLERLDAETANLRTALAHAGPGLALRLVDALAWYWFLRGRLTEARRSLAAALASATPGAPPAPGTHPAPGAPPAPGPHPAPGAPPAPGAQAVPGVQAVPAEDRAAYARVAAWLAGFALLAGDDEEPVRRAGAALALFEDVDDAPGRARAEWFVAFARRGIGDPADTDRLVERALDGFRAAGDRWGVAAALGARATRALARGDLAALVRNAEESLRLFREIGDRWGRLRAGENLAVAAEVAGDYDRAAELRAEGLRMAEDLGLWTEVSWRLSGLGRLALLTGDHDRAYELHERARALAKEQASRPAEEFAETGLALGARRAGRLDEAETRLRKWLGWMDRLEASNGRALALAELGFVAELRGDAERALELHREGHAVARGTGDPRALALALEGLAGAHTLTGDHAHAARLLGAAATLRTSAGAPLPEAERADVDRIAGRARAALGEAAFTESYAAGQARPDVPPLP
ncbi:BTAD domain-containing putative transcriptional regulator [Bailinhaonella thermotolerans]|uniref:AfsR/SARP family transcriptional regulator n=1 Tax=Bailinhaonella thermotolerans TaxID=1070861 RepID=A0A3A4A8V7_9ACTN|nr:BTAD domain-containing putative transcriptional regulator [Bailinhaonella thermotolerans]RJL24439.1 AfsR/SARP family transcriptional regulator [Bailinhaonella thermotolerans]